MIDFECPNCGSEIHAQDSAAGKRGKCKSCQQVIAVPNFEKKVPSAAPLASASVRRASISPVLKYGLPILGVILLYGVFTAKPRSGRPPSVPIPSDVSFTVVKENNVRGKRVLDVRVNKRVAEEVLQSIAWRLKEGDSSKPERTLIAFYLPETAIGSGAWATANFDPRLKIQILGVPAAQEQRPSQPTLQPSREMIGSWLQDGEPFPGKITLFHEDSALYMAKTFTDGTTSKELMVEQQSNTGRKFMKADRIRPSDDYYVIDAFGNFQIWSQDTDGSFVLVVTAKKIN